MSRYKLTRLLTASGVGPVHRGGKTIYFDADEAGQAVRDRLARESSAITLDVLADRTGISAALLAQKVRQGCISTTGQAIHAVDAAEAERISAVVRSLRDSTDSIATLGVCRLHSRGRTGEEVAAWDIGHFIKLAESMTPHSRKRLFWQVAWLCEGAGRRRLVEAVHEYIHSHQANTGVDQKPIAGAETLLELLDHLPAAVARYRSLVSLLASGTYVARIAQGLRDLTRLTGPHSSTSYARLRAQVDDSVADLLTREGIHSISGRGGLSTGRNGSMYPDDDFVEGAVVLCINGLQAEVGLVVHVEQQAWNSVIRAWDKTVVVRFAEGERRINPHTRTKNGEQSAPRVTVLLRSAEALSLVRSMREKLYLGPTPGTEPNLPSEYETAPARICPAMEHALR
jgi:hypothetical protein